MASKNITVEWLPKQTTNNNPFIATIDFVKFSGHLSYKYGRGQFVIRFDNKLIVKHPQYRDIRRVVLLSYREYSDREIVGSWMQGAKDSFKRA